MAKNDGTQCVLLMRFSALGDVAIGLPVVYSLCAAYPQVRFVMLTRPVPARLMVQCPHNLTVVGADVKGRYKGIGGLLRLARELRRDYGITAVADLHSVMRSWVIDASMRLSGIRVARIDKGRREKRQLTQGRIHRQLATSQERYVAVLERLGFKVTDDFKGFSGLQSPLLPAKEAGQKWVAIAPFSQHRGKELPLTTISQVMERLLASHPEVSLFLMGGGEQERRQLHALAMQHGRTLSMADAKHGFIDEFALFGQCDVMLSMDSANMHLASLCRLPVISVWGATHPYCGFMGWHQSQADAVQLPLDCRPCSVFGQKPCRLGDYRCLTGITPDMIIEKLEKYL